ncbi:MAG: hypothetical protein ABIH55_01345 [Nanoarchaeota archaeon]
MRIVKQLNGKTLTKTNRSFAKGWIAGVVILTILAYGAYFLL